MPRWRRAVSELAMVAADLSPLPAAAGPRLGGGRLGWVPAGAVAALALGAGALAAVAAVRPPAALSPAAALLLAALLAAPLGLALIRPVAALWASLIAAALISEVLRAGGDGPVWAAPALLAHLFILGLVALTSRPPVAVVAWGLTAITGAALVQRMPGMNAAADLGAPLLAAAVVTLAGMTLRGWQADRRRLAEAASTAHDERTRRRVLEERTRIARELHDVVAHHMSVVAIQAEAAPYRVPEPPRELEGSLRLIRTHAVEALTELRRVLGVLRDGASPVDTTPRPGLGRLPELVATAGQVGLDARLTVNGSDWLLPAGVDVSVYRIVQEAVSNAMRHAPGATVEVAVDIRPDRLELQVANGPARQPPTGGPGAGHGLLGMRERVGMLGGTLTAAPDYGGGFTVRARLPLDPASVVQAGQGR
ncbi:sensor histidine kinase [Geodermatophilus marinus]|uniref:sensor histidine kinase n=1 Tax=Geodermatophilus sp. LHW52908 TaxID=2303986 RepID=UPI001314463E|nr:sensor histidine kinase [Geodermatophilus sp. LHW52908]